METPIADRDLAKVQELCAVSAKGLRLLDLYLSNELVSGESNGYSNNKLCLDQEYTNVKIVANSNCFGKKAVRNLKSHVDIRVVAWKLSKNGVQTAQRQTVQKEKQNVWSIPHELM